MGPEYEEYMDRGGSRGTSPGGRHTWGGRAGGGEDWRRGAGPDSQSTMSTQREEAPGGHHPEVGTLGREDWRWGMGPEFDEYTEAAPGEHHPAVGTPGKGRAGAGRTGGGARGQSSMSTQREAAPGEHHPEAGTPRKGGLGQGELEAGHGARVRGVHG